MRPCIVVTLIASLFVMAVPAYAQFPGLELKPPGSISAQDDSGQERSVPPIGDETHEAEKKPRSQAAEWAIRALKSTTRALRDVKDGIKEATNLTDDQLFGIGIGVLTGVAVADVLGTGGLGSIAIVGIGGMVGNWMVTRGDNGQR